MRVDGTPLRILQVYRGRTGAPSVVKGAASCCSTYSPSSGFERQFLLQAMYAPTTTTFITVVAAYTTDATAFCFPFQT